LAEHLVLGDSRAHFANSENGEAGGVDAVLAT
jgi:hypothetical protein